MGPVAIVSQSGGLGANVFAPLMTDRELGFGHFVSCGNQIGTVEFGFLQQFIHRPGDFRNRQQRGNGLRIVADGSVEIR